MRESMLEAILEKDQEKLMDLMQKKTNEISRAAMPCPAGDLPLVAAILELVAGEMMKTARRQPGILDADGAKNAMLAAIQNQVETSEVTMPLFLADKLREMGDKLREMGDKP